MSSLMRATRASSGPRAAGWWYISLLLCLLARPVLSAVPSHPPRAPSSPDCRPIPGTAEWPSDAAWQGLNESTGGRLLRPAPPGAVCHPGQPGYDAGRCPDLWTRWQTPDFHVADPVSSMWNNFNNDSCLPDPRYPCSGQGYPVFVVNASAPAHVKAGIDFAKKHGIRLIVKSTGHDFIGRSSAPNALSIWTRHLRGFAYAESFQPKGCNVTIQGGVLTAGAGTQMREAYQYLAAFNQTIVGGNGPTVSLGGFVTGGGHSILGPRNGMAVDRVLEMELVTPTGEIVTANECTNTDLFWALRGGGGSTFGVLTSVTMLTVSSPKMLHIQLSIAALANSSAAPNLPAVAAYVISHFPTLGDQGLSGWMYAYQNTSTNISGMICVMALQDTEDRADMDRLWDPILAHVNATWPGFQIDRPMYSYQRFAQWYANHYDKGLVGDSRLVAGHMLDDAALADQKAIAGLVSQVFGPDRFGAFIVSGKGVWNAKPRGGSTALLPAWRKVHVHAPITLPFPSFDKAAEAVARRRAVEMTTPYKKLSPDTGAYMNEAFVDEPDFQKTFWGANYPRLHAIKRAVDPHDVLWCQPCVGNERWKEVDGRLCRVKQCKARR